MFDADELGLDPEDDDELVRTGAYCQVCGYPVEECDCEEEE